MPRSIVYEALDTLEDAARMRGVPLDDEIRQPGKQGAPAPDGDLMALAETIPNTPDTDPARDAATRWERWNRIGMAFHAASGGSDEGLAAFDRWAAKRDDIYTAATTAARWGHWATSPAHRLDHW